MKVEAIKAMIDIFKNILTIFLVGFFGMVSYIFVNIEKISLIKFLILAVGVLFVGIIIIFCAKILLKKIKELEELK